MMANLSSELLNEVRKNQETLQACPRHEFKPITPGLFGTRYVCINCKGTVDGVSVKWYETGLNHGGSRVQTVCA